MSKQAVVVRADGSAWETREVYRPETYGAVRWQTLLSGDRTASTALTMGIAELPPGAQLVRHWHEQPETYFILTGSGIVESDGVEQAVGVETAVFIPGGTSHFIQNTSDVLMRLIYTFPADSFQEIQYHYENEDERLEIRE